MARPEIHRKLGELLEHHNPLTEECQCVYLMVEIRKYLDQLDDGGANFKLLRFYCDWTVHTRKDRNLAHIAPIISEMYASAKREIQDPHKLAPGSATKLIYFSALRTEMNAFLESIWIQSHLTSEDDAWIAYVKLMASILADQPIIKPTADVTLFTFEPAEEDCVAGRIEFAEPVDGADKVKYLHYSFANAY
jgi:hypothetical protein